MSLITIVKHNLRQWAINRLVQDIDWARASSDAYIDALQDRKLEYLRAQDTRNSQDVARDAGRSAKEGLLS